jgi:hypothetical protein
MKMIKLLLFVGSLVFIGSFLLIDFKYWMDFRLNSRAYINMLISLLFIILCIIKISARHK